MRSVTVIGLGYAGLILAASLADRGVRVHGFDRRSDLCRQVARGDAPFTEAGLAEALRRTVGHMLVVDDELPPAIEGDVVICVGTPIDADCRPMLDDLAAAVASAAERMEQGALLVVRSTVPVGTTRRLVVPILARQERGLVVAFCPERTIQGRAMAEIVTLPQIVGAADTMGSERARALFAPLEVPVVSVSSLEVAELAKLVNNCHTDVLYGFGNEVALLAERHGIDAAEVIAATNLDYPRPDIHRPGFVGGGCLSKDPFILLDSFETRDGLPIIAAARRTNEALPRRVADRILGFLRTSRREHEPPTILVSGFAFKGRPETDDTRGAPAPDVIAALAEAGCRILGHDFIVKSDRISLSGAEPVTWHEGVRQADALVVLTDHADYGQIAPEQITPRDAAVRLVYDAWGVLSSAAPRLSPDVTYMRLGDGRPA